MDPKNKTTTAATAETKAPTYYASRDFTDAGTGRNFAKNADLSDLDPKVIDNYRFAGLATTKPDAETAA